MAIDEKDEGFKVDYRVRLLIGGQVVAVLFQRESGFELDVYSYNLPDKIWTAAELEELSAFLVSHARGISTVYDDRDERP